MMQDSVVREYKYWNDIAKTVGYKKHISDKHTSDSECVDSIYSHISRAKRVIELGCGIGRLTIPLAKIMDKAKFTGIDISDEMLNKANNSLQASNLNNVRFQQNNGRDIVYPRSTCDAIYSMTTFQHIPEAGVRHYIKQAARALRVGGIFRFQFAKGLDKIGFSQTYTLKEMSEWLEEAGFMVVEAETGLIEDVWIWITAKRLSESRKNNGQN